MNNNKGGIFMVDILLFALNVAWKVLCLVAGWILFRYVLKNGKGAIHEILDTISLILTAGCKVLKKKLVQLLRKENGQIEESTAQPTNQVEAEGTVV